MTYSELIEKAISMLNSDGELFVDMVNELDSWNGFADGFRAYPMWELDELFGDCKVSDFLDKLAPGFNNHDEYMVDTIYGLDSTDDIEGLYRDNVYTGELLDNIIDNWNHLYFSDSDFENLINEIVNFSEDDTETEDTVLHSVVSKVIDSLTVDSDPESVTA